MRKIEDLCNGTKRLCRRCEKVLPISEFSQVPRRHICKLCKSRQFKRVPISLVGCTWQEVVMRHMAWDATHIYKNGYRFRRPDITAVALQDGFEFGKDTECRIVPIDFRSCISVHNAVLTHDKVGKVLRKIAGMGDLQFYQHCLGYWYKDAKQPFELVLE